MGKVIAISISEARGTKKIPQTSVEFQENWGIKEDAHGGTWHRQVSLLSADKVEAFREKGAKISAGDFAENLLVQGIDFAQLPVGTWLKSGNIILQVTQIGKECHTHCEIYQQMGDCIMPREGVFAKVIHGGPMSVGDVMEIIPCGKPCPPRAGVITLSDRSYAGEREDESGKLLVNLLEKSGFQVEEARLIPDEQVQLERNLCRMADQLQLDLVLTTGGTGLSPRDITPEGTLAVADRLVPGISEEIRRKSIEITAKAMLSRGVSVIRGKTLIINLPGSPKACQECFDIFSTVLPHAVEVLRGDTLNCGQVN
ncbi:MAG: molybdenum cofactor synthesis domain-containing protein [Eubacteriales bacterium]